jgi:hypothetical protein
MDFYKTGMSLWQKIAITIGALVFIGLIVLVVFLYTQYQSLKKNPNGEKEAEVKQLVEQIRKFYDLPTDENPTVATVSDKSKVVNQPFFAKAENGDKILIYRKNKLAILFRPSQNRLINVGPIDLDAVSGNSTGSGSTTQAAIAKLGLYNASSTVGITTDVEKKLTTSAYASQISIAEKKNANSKSLGKVLIVDVAGSNKDLAEKIAATLGGEVGSLPAGETKPGVDIAVFIGK